MIFPTYKIEKIQHKNGFTLIAGCDEVGVAPLAGPVVAACVILIPKTVEGRRSKNKWWARIRDSKTVHETERIELEKYIKENSVAYSVGEVSHETVDEVNIFNASRLAQKKSVDGLSVKPGLVLVDGPYKIPNLEVPQLALVDGDAKVLSIAAASILAKVYRDNFMKQLHQKFPMYGFDEHKGYPTKKHFDAIKKYGVSPFHRQSFAPVKQIILDNFRMEKFRQM